MRGSLPPHFHNMYQEQICSLPLSFHYRENTFRIFRNQKKLNLENDK
jgi:hypothetical protein